MLIRSIKEMWRSLTDEQRHDLASRLADLSGILMERMSGQFLADGTLVEQSDRDLIYDGSRSVVCDLTIDGFVTACDHKSYYRISRCRRASVE